ncbi:MAG TPA: outer membrane beta-barrel protein, partial [Crocinitomicaceae bacterium]|nr:outer membrane beta-barrel protein [Crocinitomicaceae bacterium]
NSSAFQTFTSSARWAWYGKLNVSFKLPKQFMIQWTTMYQSKSNLPVNDGNKMWGPPMDRVQSTSQGYIDQFWAMDISVRKTFFEKKFAVTLSVSDMFGTKRYISVSQSEYFYQNYDRLANPFMVRLNLSWTFGKVDTTLFKRLNKGMGEEPAME